MRISDGSSDVCSSDLAEAAVVEARQRGVHRLAHFAARGRAHLIARFPRGFDDGFQLFAHDVLRCIDPSHWPRSVLSMSMTSGSASRAPRSEPFFIQTVVMPNALAGFRLRAMSSTNITRSEGRRVGQACVSTCR